MLSTRWYGERNNYFEPLANISIVPMGIRKETTYEYFGYWCKGDGGDSSLQQP